MATTNLDFRLDSKQEMIHIETKDGQNTFSALVARLPTRVFFEEVARRCLDQVSMWELTFDENECFFWNVLYRFDSWDDARKAAGFIQCKGCRYVNQQFTFADSHAGNCTLAESEVKTL